MNSLERSIARRQAADATAVSCVELGSRPTLALIKWEARRWLLPWSHLECMSLGGPDEADALTLAFARYHVAVVGDNLGAIWSDLANLNVTALRELPASYRQRVGADAIFIRSLELKPVTGS